MAGSAFGSRALFQYSHSASIFFAVLLFLAGFLCTLLWTNNIVRTPTSAANAMTSTFTYYSPAVSTFSITYQVAIFGTAWNSIIFAILLVLERDALPISTERLRYEAEKAAGIIAISGNAVYSVACFALMATLARLAADPPAAATDSSDIAASVAASGTDRRAGQGVTAAMAGLAGAAAVWACMMDALHVQDSRLRRIDRQEPLSGEGDALKQA